MKKLICFLLLHAVVEASPCNHRGLNDGSSWNKFPFDGDEKCREVIILDKRGDVCLTANLNMEIKVSDWHIVIHNGYKLKPNYLEFPVKTSNYTGVCAGETALLSGRNITGPAIEFVWSCEDQHHRVMLMWKLRGDDTFLEAIIIAMNITEPMYRKVVPLNTEKDNLTLFQSEIGTFVNVTERQDIKFNIDQDSDQELTFIFKTVNYVIEPEDVMRLSIVVVVLLILAFIFFICLGTYFYFKGSRREIHENSKMST